MKALTKIATEVKLVGPAHHSLCRCKFAKEAIMKSSKVKRAIMLVKRPAKHRNKLRIPANNAVNMKPKSSHALIY